jgi:hypothetical protein
MVCSFHGLGSLVCSVSELIFETTNPFIYFDRIPWTVIGPSPGFYLHRTAKYKEMWTYKHASSGIRTHDTNA